MAQAPASDRTRVNWLDAILAQMWQGRAQVYYWLLARYVWIKLRVFHELARQRMWHIEVDLSERSGSFVGSPDGARSGSFAAAAVNGERSGSFVGSRQGA